MTRKKEKGILEFRFFGRIYRFATESGIFSYREVDSGTGILLETLVKVLSSGGTGISRINIRDASVLDLGCGYGVIGIVLADIFRPRRVVMLDNDPRALSLARKNVRDMNLNNVEILRSDICSGLSPDERFDLIVTNPPIKYGRSTVLRFMTGGREHLSPGGEFWCVIMSRHGARRYLESMKVIFDGSEIYERESGYMVLRGWVNG